MSDSVEEDLRAILFVLDAQQAQPSFRRLRDWAIAQLAPAPGDVALDIGSGAGAVTRDLAVLVGSEGRAIGIEPNAGLRAVAVARSAGLTPAPTFVDGDAMSLPFDDASVDVVHCERVWQHLSEPARAAAEIARVLRPGGRAAVLDSDWGTMLVEPGDPDIVRRALQASWDASPNPFSGRRLRGLLRGAGLLVEPDIGSSAYVMSEEMIRHGAMSGEEFGAARTAGAITEEESESVLAGLRTALDRGEAFMSVSMFAVVARRTSVTSGTGAPE